jgi:hypothetical protein
MVVNFSYKHNGDRKIMNLWKIYNESIPEFILEASKTEPMARLKDVGMNCGCEYTSFPRFKNLLPSSRFDHSVGVGLIVLHFTGNKAQSLAGLFHDIATPTFAHVIDFLKGDHITQESTEEGTTDIIEKSPEIQEILIKNGLKTENVSDYHIYPIADNDSPKLSADRLEYTLLNLVNYKFGTETDAMELYRDIVVGDNEFGEKELCFKTPEIGLRFSEFSLQCSKVYVADEDRFSMEALANLLKNGISEKIITESDFYSTETKLIEKLKNNKKYSDLWENYRSYSSLRISSQPDLTGEWYNVSAKKRYIDPFILNYGRISSIYPKYSKKLQEFKDKSQDYWMMGER